MRRVASVLLALAAAAPAPTLAQQYDGYPRYGGYRPGVGYDITTPRPTPSVAPPPSSVPGVPLRRPKHAERLARVQGFIAGMTNKLTNLSERLDQQLQNFERRIAALRAAGHTIAVEEEFAAARAAVTSAQTAISTILQNLAAVPDIQTPRQAIREVRGQIRDLRAQIRSVREAFDTLRKAIRDDVRAARPTPGLSEPSPSPTP